MLLPLLAAAGLGLWAVAEDERTPPSRRYPQRFRRRSTLFDRVLFAFKHFGKDQVRRDFFWALSHIENQYDHFLMRTGVQQQIATAPIWRLVPPMDMTSRRLEPHIFWLVREIDRMNRQRERHFTTEPDDDVLGTYGDCLRELVIEWPSIRDWVVQENISLQDKTWSDAIAEARAWHQAGFSKEGTYRAPVVPGVPVMVWPDGARLDRLVTKQQLEQEGQSMNHCVGGYWPEARDGDVAIYSYRNPEGVPYATLAFDTLHAAVPQTWNLTLSEFKGHNDEVIINEAVQRRMGAWIDFMGDHKIVIDDDESDMTAVGGSNAWIDEEDLDRLRAELKKHEDPYEVLKVWFRELEAKYSVWRAATEELNEVETDPEADADQVKDMEEKRFTIQDDLESLIELGAPVDNALAQQVALIREATKLDIDFNYETDQDIDGHHRLGMGELTDNHLYDKWYIALRMKTWDVEVHRWANPSHGYLFVIIDDSAWADADGDKGDSLLNVMLEAGIVEVISVEREKPVQVLTGDPAWISGFEPMDFALPQQEFVEKYGTQVPRKDKYQYGRYEGLVPGLAVRTRPRRLFWPPGAGDFR
jgi:hypothetical protein